MITKEIVSPETSLVPIVELGVGNEIYQDGVWSWEKAQVITLAIFWGNKITIHQKEKTDSEQFWKRYITQKLSKMPPMYCMRGERENKIVKYYLGINRFFEDIPFFKGKGINKETIFSFLNKTKPYTSNLNDPLNGNTGLIPHSYASNKYEDIVNYFIFSLVKQYHIFNHRFYLMDILGGKINSNGWYNGDFKEEV